MTPAHDMPAVLVTGSSSGIGEACALELDRRGCRVFAGVRSEVDGQRLGGQASPRLTPVMLDVTDADSIAHAAAAIREATGARGLDGLVNNAGVVVASPLEFLPLDELRRQFEVNVVGQLAVTQAMLPILRAAGGRIVMISSSSGFIAAPFIGPYAASKHALGAIGDSLRVELRRCGIRVSLVAPADVKTPIWEKSLEAVDRLRERMGAEGRGRHVQQEVQDRYAEDMDAMKAATIRAAARAMPVGRVVRAVVHALCAPEPRTRYLIGADTIVAARVLRHLPDRLRDWIIRRNFGLK